jgi:hypothetical protein
MLDALRGLRPRLARLEDAQDSDRSKMKFIKMAIVVPAIVVLPYWLIST